MDSLTGGSSLLKHFSYYVWQALLFLAFPLLLLDFIAYFLIVIFDNKQSWKSVFKSTGLKPSLPISRTRLLFAQSLVLVWYIWACTAYLLWPPLFIYHLVDNKKDLDGISESESLQASVNGVPGSV